MPADAFGMLGTVVSRPKMAQLSMETLQKLGVSAVDARVLATGTLLLFAVSLAEENGKDVRGWLGGARPADSLGNPDDGRAGGAADGRLGKRLQRSELHLL